MKNHNHWCQHFRDGHRVPDFNTLPTQLHEPKPLAFDAQETEFLQQEIQRLLAKGVIEHSQQEEGKYISTVFLRPKKNGSYRVILNLKNLNTDVAYHHFRMDTLESCINLMSQGCYMASLDLTDAYYSVHVAQCCQKYLKFRFGNKLYKYTCLPNGLSSGPGIFTKLMKPVFSKLRQSGHILSGYLDDSYLQGASVDECTDNVTDTKQLLCELGFGINEEKSVCVPTQQLNHLCFLLNSVDMTVALGRDNVQKI